MVNLLNLATIKINGLRGRAMRLKQDFMQRIANQVFGASLSEEKTKEKRCFLRRFDPENTLKQNQEIASLIRDDMNSGYCVDTIARTIRKVIEGLVTEYEAEIKADKIDPKSWLNRDRAQKGAWKEVYDWLWNRKYLRWLEAHSWEILQSKAQSPSNWLQFLTAEEMVAVERGTRGLILPPSPPSAQKTPPTIPANQSLWMVIDLALQNYQLLLLHGSQQNQSLLCPSSAYAPNSLIEKSPILLPQKNSWADQDEKKQNFMFEEAEKEEFLAIALEKPLNLSWLTPCKEEALPEWNAERIKELFDQLEQQGNWHVFYQSFEVQS